jgi:AcrR family transcriptional regulator
LLHGTISCIQEFGYYGTTTTMICRRAHVTRGALQHHFGGRKAKLMAATVEELYDRMQGPYLGSMAAIDSSRPADAARALFVQLSRLIEAPESIALIEIWLATRAEPELARSVLPTIRKIDGVLTEAWNRLFGGVSQGDIYRTIGRALSSGLPVELLVHNNAALLRRTAVFVGELIARDIDERGSRGAQTRQVRRSVKEPGEE